MRTALSPSGLPLVAAIAVVAPALAAAQTTEGYIGGQVRLPDGSPAVGAAVQVKNEGTGLLQSRTTGADGRFAFPALPIGGPYSVTIRRIGYRPERITGITLNLGDRVPVRITLQAAPQELGTVAVRESREDARGARFLGSTIVDQQKLEQLPILNRSFSD
nr:carboxypeptidase-like regulatory domain-containing protein [Gemmatimonadaceae bacterium]